jgi:hypothetical protein
MSNFWIERRTERQEAAAHAAIMNRLWSSGYHVSPSWVVEALRQQGILLVEIARNDA